MDTINMFKYSRTSTLILLSNIDEAIWDKQPEPFSNTIRWNAGHVYAESESFLNDADHNYKVTRPDWADIFIDGTRPTEWPDRVPSKDEIIDALKDQEARVEAFFRGKNPNKVSKIRDVNGLLLETVDASIQFITWHEGIHLGITKAYRSLLRT